MDELETGYDTFLESWRQEILAHTVVGDTPQMDARSDVE